MFFRARTSWPTLPLHFSLLPDLGQAPAGGTEGEVHLLLVIVELVPAPVALAIAEEPLQLHFSVAIGRLELEAIDHQLHLQPFRAGEKGLEVTLLPVGERREG